MKDYGRIILDDLLGRYERSAHFQGEGRRAVSLRPDRKNLPEYWDDTSADQRLLVHRALADLEADGLIEVKWPRHAAGLEVSRVILRLERLEEAYRRVGRTPRAVLEQRLRATALAWRAGLPDWGQAFVDDLAGALAGGRPLPAGFAPGEDELLVDVLRATAALNPADPAPRRVFSLRVFGASKHFEQQVEGRLVRVLREFHPGGGTTEDWRELLAELGLTENPDHLYLAGPLVLEYDGRTLDLAPFAPDVGLPAGLVAGARVVSLAAEQVLTVENLTTFHLLAARRPERALLIYLGGYHNRLRREFLHRLWQAAPGAAFRHWGDIDLGGFQIFRLLREGSGVPLEPYRMDLETYRAYADTGTPFGADYRRKLAALLDTPGYEVFRPVITEVLRLGRRVEQEAIPVDTAAPCAPGSGPGVATPDLRPPAASPLRSVLR